MKKIKKPKAYVWLPLAGLALIASVTMNVLVPTYWDVIAAAFTDSQEAMDDSFLEESLAESKAMNIRTESEGAVLLKNDNDILPLKGVSKINTYGVVSAHVYPNGSGSGAISTDSDSVTTLKKALAENNIEVNDALWKLESSSKISGTTSSVKEDSTTDLVTEISLADYASAESWDAAKSYSPYAIVTIGRMFSEGSDAARGQLSLTSGEKALLQQLHSQGFKVITLINSSNVIELGTVDACSDAVLWIGGPGTYGLSGISDLLSGKVSPSGRTVDTWMYDQKTSSTYYTAASYTYENVSRGYTNYNEGIYVGYRWYETADAENYFASVSNSYGTGYEGVVDYPFGYGLSYGELEEEIVSVERKDNQLVFTVKTANKNDIPSRSVLELYVEKPYTEGGVEVSKVELVGFDKSPELTSGDDGYTATITVNEDDLYSYDSKALNGQGGYVLAGGTYNFYLASGTTGAHCWKDADAKHTYSVSLEEKTGRSSDAVKAQNQFSADKNDNGVAIDDATSGYVQLSRANHFANASSTISQTANAKKITLDKSSALYTLLNDASSYSSYDKDLVSKLDNLKLNQSKKYSLSDLYTKDENGNALFSYDYETNTKTILEEVSYDDSRWDYLLSQMSEDELNTLIGRAGYMTASVESIDKAKMNDYDGPFGLNNYMQSSLGIQSKCTSFNSEVVTASTWDEDLVTELGKCIGKEANATGQVGWYAPGANIHRTPFGGRNAEYFSEDSFLSGRMASSESGGALSVGLYCVAKHFAFNDIEANRTSGENCWMSEQTAREIYLRPYEMGIKEGTILALMDSYMWICGDWNGASYSLLTKVVRDEWGFKGMITTDNAGGSGGVNKWITPSRIICAGGDMVLNVTAMKVDASLKSTDAGISAMKTAAKHILYTVAVANEHRLREAKLGYNKFIPIYIGANVVINGALIAFASIYVIKLIRYRKSSSEETKKESN